jgi:hypothetical protein
LHRAAPVEANRHRVSSIHIGHGRRGGRRVSARAVQQRLCDKGGAAAERTSTVNNTAPLADDALRVANLRFVGRRCRSASRASPCVAGVRLGAKFYIASCPAPNPSQNRVLWGIPLSIGRRRASHALSFRFTIGDLGELKSSNMGRADGPAPLARLTGRTPVDRDVCR